ncbi:hypothetical protein GJAV_G00240160 [Gymnothorax javanicus]|nr:hypothetical protein GJAV_G00240160 [Gymnothorax javanicus]
MAHLLNLVTFLVLCLLGHYAAGAPAKARYMWVRCRPDGSNANCVKERGPWVSLRGAKDRLPPSAIWDIMKANLDWDFKFPEGSGSTSLLVEFGSGEESSTDWGSGDQFSSDWGSGDQFSSDLGSGDQFSTDWSSGDQFTTDWQDLELLLDEGRLEGSGLEANSLEGSESVGSSMEGSGLGSSESVIDYTDFVYPHKMTVQQSNNPPILDQQEDNFNP